MQPQVELVRDARVPGERAQHRYLHDGEDGQCDSGPCIAVRFVPVVEMAVEILVVCEPLDLREHDLPVALLLGAMFGVAPGARILRRAILCAVRIHQPTVPSRHE